MKEIQSKPFLVRLAGDDAVSQAEEQGHRSRLHPLYQIGVKTSSEGHQDKLYWSTSARAWPTSLIRTLWRPQKPTEHIRRPDKQTGSKIDPFHAFKTASSGAQKWVALPGVAHSFAGDFRLFYSKRWSVHGCAADSTVGLPPRLTTFGRFSPLSFGCVLFLLLLRPFSQADLTSLAVKSSNKLQQIGRDLKGYLAFRSAN
jgi:hypothetical protein